MYKARTQEEILSELQSWSQVDASKIEGTFEYDVLSSNAIEFAKTELELAEICTNAYGHTAANEYLEMKAEEAGVIRRPANKAVGTLTVTGNGTVYEGAIFSTTAGARFLATETVEVDGTAEVAIIAEKAGKAGNVGAGTIKRIPINIPGIRACTNAAAAYDGYDEESDDELRERYLTKVRYPGVSGNP